MSLQYDPVKLEVEAEVEVPKLEIEVEVPKMTLEMTFGNDLRKMTLNDLKNDPKNETRIPKFPQECANSDALNKKNNQPSTYVGGGTYVEEKNNNFRANNPSPSSEKPRK